MIKKEYSSTRTPSAFFYNGISSTVSAIALRASAMLFNVYLSSTAGAGAMGLLSLVYSVWGFALTLGCVSGGFLSSRIYASESSLGGNVYRGSSMCVRFTFICGAFIGTLLFFGSDALSFWVLEDARCSLPLKILAFSLPFISASGTIEGYFNACTRSYKAAGMRMCEQLIRISVTAFAFLLLGHKNDRDACINIVLSGATTEIISFTLLLALFIRDRRTHLEKTTSPAISTYREMASLVLPLTLSTGMRSALTSIEHIMIPKGLVSHGSAYNDALSLFGTIHGMALPVVLFCFSVPSSFASLLIPRIAELSARKNKKEISYVAGRAYRLATCFSFAVAAFIILSSKVLGNILYPGTSAGIYVYVLAPLIPIMYIDSVSDSFLKGLNCQLYSMRINIIDSIISLVCVVFLIPRLGISGYIVAIYASETFNTCASLVKVLKKTGYKIPVTRYVIIPLLCAIFSAKLTKGAYILLCTHHSGLLFPLLSAAVFFTATYFILLTLTRNITEDEKRWIKVLVKSPIK